MSQDDHGKTYLRAWLLLLALTAVSFGLSRVELGSAAPVVALSIAAAKATVVVLAFMHVAGGALTTKLIVVINAVFVALLCLGIAGDVVFR